ncbi:MAG: proline--tRNA ligase [Candidatus Aenigmarchaeota archaeon]|nr:proline--tRNA ligase [Candidatus Aenigmarchaeota archaeon]NIP40320.1 proline--tRNA ligase [Candidatus Aenigmarchaeota archaeon]NIQ17814.1 proline--tRNA ligase [Candidatus Aenigmarchaeota archaeon]NIS73195.1 proline--tRNA ligase [Candidatus Aenigmarchaeota archaeon]
MKKKKSQREEVAELKVSKSRDFSEWYNQVVQKAGLADYAPISGCMIIRPYGFAVWEKIQGWLDRELKRTGVENAYFPIFIPERFLKRESEHFEGFVPEVAWIEKMDENEERYALRPTSETIMYDAYSKWIRSWRDLPLRINQWNNIVRWEVKATRLFLRTREFLWQEGHTVHSTGKECEEEVLLRAEQYKKLVETRLAIPVVIGKKSKSETFAGALYTIALEALMPDGKGLQMGTSHNLGQHFAKVFGIRFLDRDGEKKHAWQTSWGLSTRTIGALAMVHGDDKGLVLPPRIAPIQVIIIPIYDNKTKGKVLKEGGKVRRKLEGKFEVHLDDRDSYSPGWKFNEWELKGVPVRLEIGPKDIRKKQVVLVRRDNGVKKPVKEKGLVKELEKTLEAVQENLFSKARSFLNANTKYAKNFRELERLIKNRKMARAYWCGSEKCEGKIKEKTGATIRCIKEESAKKEGKCADCGKQSKTIAYFAKAY